MKMVQISCLNDVSTIRAEQGRTRRLLHQLTGQLLREVLIRSLRGSLLIGGGLLTLSSTGLWQYVESSFNAHDVRRAAAWTPSTDTSTVVVLAIDDEGFERFFGGRSPLDRTKMIQLLETVHENAKLAESIALDIDLSPGAGEDPSALVNFLGTHGASRWVLVDPVLQAEDPQPERAAWRQCLCDTGVRFGHPYQPTEFGYGSPTHQFAGALPAVALDPTDNCARQLQRKQAPAGALRKVAAPVSPIGLKDGVVIPFSGDLGTVALALDSLQPRYVFIGGTWGKLDVFATPFQERYGVQMHAASAQGQMDRHRLAPHGVRLAVSWLVVALMSMAFTFAYQRLTLHVAPWASTLPGHQFIMKRAWPMALLGMTFASLLLVAEALAFLHAQTGYWIPSAHVAITVTGSMLFVWNWGLNDISTESSLKSAWTNVVIKPIQADRRSAAHAWQWLRAGSPATLTPPVSRPRAALELLCASSSLLVQTMLPMLSLAYAIGKPL